MLTGHTGVTPSSLVAKLKYRPRPRLYEFMQGHRNDSYPSSITGFSWVCRAGLKAYCWLALVWLIEINVINSVLSSLLPW